MIVDVILRMARRIIEPTSRSDCFRCQKSVFCLYQTKDAFLNDVFRCAERDARFARDICLASDVRFARDKRNKSHHFAAKPQYITVCRANCITCALSANITLQS